MAHMGRVQQIVNPIHARDVPRHFTTDDLDRLDRDTRRRWLQVARRRHLRNKKREGK